MEPKEFMENLHYELNKPIELSSIHHEGNRVILTLSLPSRSKYLAVKKEYEKVNVPIHKLLSIDQKFFFENIIIMLDFSRGYALIEESKYNDVNGHVIEILNRALHSRIKPSTINLTTTLKGRVIAMEIVNGKFKLKIEGENDVREYPLLKNNILTGEISKVKTILNGITFEISREAIIVHEKLEDPVAVMKIYNTILEHLHLKSKHSFRCIIQDNLHIP